MKILIISKYGDALGIGHKMVMEGHDVLFYIQDSRYKNSGVGLVERIPSWRPVIRSVDLVICDMVGFGKHEDTIRRLGKPFISCNALADMAELDRAKGMDLFNQMNINTPTTYNFKKPKDARDLVDIWPILGLVVKPSGNVGTDKTFVTKSPDSYLWALDQLDDDQDLIVQEFVEGIEISTEGWYNGRDWIKPFNHTFEEKKFLTGGLGQNTGCMGNIVIRGKETSRLVKETVMLVKPFLDKISYRGPVDINAIVNETDLYALEFTFRIGYDAIEALSSAMLEPLGNFLFEVATGIKSEFDMRPFAIAIRVSVPPWPMAEPTKDQVGTPIEGIDEGALKHIYLTDVILDDGEYKFAGGDGVVYKATAAGDDVRSVQKRVKRTLENVTLQDMQYRTDIGDRVIEEKKQLIQWGWLDA